MLNTEQIAAFQNSGIECLVQSLNKPKISDCFKKLNSDTKQKLIKDISDFIEAELTNSFFPKKIEIIEELADTNSF